jgi:hypothetical protein
VRLTTEVRGQPALGGGRQARFVVARVRSLPVPLRSASSRRQRWQGPAASGTLSQVLRRRTTHRIRRPGATAWWQPEVSPGARRRRRGWPSGHQRWLQSPVPVVRRCGKRSVSSEGMATSPSKPDGVRCLWVPERAPGCSGWYEPFQSRLAPGRGRAEVVRSAVSFAVERHRRAPQGGAQESNAACFFERGLHPTAESGHCRWRHRRLEPLITAFVRRESRRVSVGVASRGELFGARTEAPGPTSSTLRCRDGGSRASGGRGQRALVAPGGFRDAVRVARDPNRIRRQGRAGAGRKLCDGEAAQSVSGGRYVDHAASSSSRVRAVAAGTQRSGRIRGRQRQRGGRDGDRRDEGHPPGVEATRSRDLWRRESSKPTGNRSAVATPAAGTGGNVVVSGEKTRLCREITHRGRRPEAASSGLPDSAADVSRGVKRSGQLGRRASGVWWITAHFQSLPRGFSRGGGGNITESGAMWANGRVQSAVAELRLVSATRRRGRQAERTIGDGELRFARSVVCSTGSPALHDKHAGTLRAWQHASGTERLRRSLTYLAEETQEGRGHLRNLSGFRR